MALGAFASKTVACTLALTRVKALSEVESGLGKGNFWLFQEIAPWHWVYSVSPDDFMSCMANRNVPDALREVPQRAVKQLPDNAKVLPTLKNMKVSKFIKNGFSLVEAIENENRKDERRALQFQHLLQIAQHEQGVILQPLIYDDPDFAKWVRRQRYPVGKQMSPDLELVFTHACETDDPELKSVAPDDTVLEDYKSRMKWIKKAAAQFHKLMDVKNNFMEAELSTIAGWVHG